MDPVVVVVDNQQEPRDVKCTGGSDVLALKEERTTSFARC